jgi:hypothetical protein
MPMTTQEIWKDRSNKYKTENWYSECEVKNIINNLFRTFKEMKHFDKTRVPRCPVCHKNMLKIDKYNFEPDCGCFKEKTRMSIG